jgi:predicted RNA-binding protein with PUA-like domain
MKVWDFAPLIAIIIADAPREDPLWRLFPFARFAEFRMPHWLFKSEPSAFSFEKLTAEGAKGTDWSGIRNHSAKLNMMAMKLGERGFFYHSNEGKAIVGIVEISALYRPDPSDDTGKFGMVDICAIEPLPKPVTLDAAKAHPELSKMALVTNSRLSVQPVTDEEWATVCELGGLTTSQRGAKRAKAPK